MDNSKSQVLFNRAQTVIPGGVNSPVRAFRAVDETPVFIKSSKEDKITDEDGNIYIDYICSWGPLIFGHGRHEIIDAVKCSLDDGFCFGLPTEKEILYAEKIQKNFPSMEMLRVTSSGTEAVMSSVRVARAFTKRRLVVKFEGCYHGHSDAVLVKAGSGLMTFGMLDSNGVTFGTAGDTMTLPYNNISEFTKFMEKNGSETACVIVEPVAANMGVVIPAQGFLEKLRELCTYYGAVLIFDEVITGLRVSKGGAQELFGVKPDMTVLGKIAGGGAPIGVFGGRNEIMKMISPAGSVYQAGTLSGNGISISAGIAALELIESNQYLYDVLEEKAAILQEGLLRCAAKYEVEVSINRAGSLLTLFFTNEQVTDMESAAKSDTKMYGQFFRGMVQEGIMLPPSQFEAWFISLAHSNESIEATIRAAENVFAKMGEV